MMTPKRRFSRSDPLTSALSAGGSLRAPYRTPHDRQTGRSDVLRRLRPGFGSCGGADGIHLGQLLLGEGPGITKFTIKKGQEAPHAMIRAAWRVSQLTDDRTLLDA